jgi:radical SAM superfamily enzyme YgiQ (UPF0313 family)
MIRSSRPGEAVKPLDEVRCLLVYPRFTLASFWNFTAACELRGAKYPAIPLGLLTVAGLLPASWQVRLVDCNVESLADADLSWADFVFVGGMLPQQPAMLEVIGRARRLGKKVVVGGPDATSSPHLYDDADYQILGEAEVTLPRWLGDLRRGAAVHRYEQGPERADVAASPRPRFDLIKLDLYLYPAVQFGRGCPFLCEFCDIIELFGRTPRLKTPPQILRELDALYELGHRGQVDFVDDNFVGNKRDVKKFLPHLIAWQEARDFPFEFSTEASINLADDDELLQLMRRAGFGMIFVGIESPDEETLRQMQKRQNTRRNLRESLERIYRYGIVVNVGYIIGFDGEAAGVAEGIIDLIDAGATPVAMVGLLYALPGTQLTRRLAREGRLHDGFDRVLASYGSGDQCTAGINFEPTRPRVDILRDLRRVIAESYDAKSYFDRIRRVCLQLDCRGKRLALRPRDTARDLIGFARLLWRQGLRASYRRPFWRMLTAVVRGNPQALRYAVGLAALYLHFGEFSEFAVSKLDVEIAALSQSSPKPIVQPALAT